MAVCDANYCFTLVDIGGYGRDNDASIFGQCKMGEGFEENEMNCPNAEIVNGYTLPYVIISDEIFPLKNWLMKPYPGKNLSEEREIFNNRLSRARRTIENAFGILAAKWRIFRRPIRGSPDTVERIIKACVCLNNYLKQTENAVYIPEGFVDSTDNTGNFVPGSWRKVAGNDSSAIQSLKRTSSNNYKKDAKLIRGQFEMYFCSLPGSVPWQNEHVRSCGEKL